VRFVIAVLVVGLCGACSHKNDTDLSVSDLAVLSGVSTAVICPPISDLARNYKISIIRIEGGKLKDCGGIVAVNGGSIKRILASLREQDGKQLLTVSLAGATIRQELPNDYSPQFWFGSSEKHIGVYVLSAAGESSVSYKKGDAIAYGVRIEPAEPKH
jgi:hypothetical protein